jgi:hypothetical protein
VIAPSPKDHPVRYLFVGLEPGTSWAPTREEALRQLKAGARCFTFQPGDFVLRYAAERWLIGHDEAFAITNLGKCCVGRRAAVITRNERFANCAPYFEQELSVFNLRALIAVGKEAKAELDRWSRRGWPSVCEIMHHSPAGTPNWPRALTKKEIDELPSVRELQSFIDDRAKENFQSRRVTARDVHLRLLALYRKQLSEIRAFL